MNRSKFFILLFLNLCFCITMYAQSEYKNVTIDRGPKPDKVDKVIVHNHNPYPCLLNFEYKIGSKESSWRNYMVDFNNFEYVKIEANETRELSLYSKIYALRIIYVDIQKPTLVECIDAIAEGWVEGKQKAQQQNQY